MNPSNLEVRAGSWGREAPGTSAEALVARGPLTQN
jgi:hypothetical protein